MENASQKIAKLLDGTFSSETETGSSTLRKNDLEGFDIGGVCVSKISIFVIRIKSLYY